MKHRGERRRRRLGKGDNRTLQQETDEKQQGKRIKEKNAKKQRDDDREDKYTCMIRPEGAVLSAI